MQYPSPNAPHFDTGRPVSPRVRAFWRAFESKDRETALKLLKEMRRDHQLGKEQDAGNL